MLMMFQCQLTLAVFALQLRAVVALREKAVALPPGHLRPTRAVSKKCIQADPYKKGETTEDVMRCHECFTETLAALRAVGGSDIVFGANDGQQFDPGFKLGYWAAVPSHTKVFVEPVPPIYNRLQKNLAGMQNVVALNKAVRGAKQGPQLGLFCWDLDMIQQTVQHGAKPLPPQVRQPLAYWDALCALDRSNLLEASNVFDTPEFGHLSAAAKDNITREVESHIVQYSVEALTPKEIVAQAGPSDVRYVQIDVEGLDNDIVRALPLGQDEFWPEVILYENHNGVEVKPFLQSHGYQVCCCFESSGNNMVAVLDTPRMP